MSKVCKDCLAEWVAEALPPTTRAARARPAPHPGPRCATHWRAFRRRLRETSWAKHIHDTFGMAADFYRALLALQGGHCAICQRATGATRRLAVDHDHKLAVTHDHPEERGCPRCWRGLLCRTCNRYVLGHLRDDKEAFRRAIDYLTHPPAQRLRTDTARAPSAPATDGSSSAGPGSSAAGAPDTASSAPRT